MRPHASFPVPHRKQRGRRVALGCLTNCHYKGLPAAPPRSAHALPRVMIGESESIMDAQGIPDGMDCGVEKNFPCVKTCGAALPTGWQRESGSRLLRSTEPSERPGSQILMRPESLSIPPGKMPPALRGSGRHLQSHEHARIRAASGEGGGQGDGDPAITHQRCGGAGIE